MFFKTLPSIQTRAISANQSKAFSLSPSQIWDGNDGAWSTFVIRVGTPSQYFRILPSTNGQETWIPIPDQCDQGQSLCGNARGVEPFNGASSGPASGSPTGINASTLDAGLTCTANKSPMCVDCISIQGKCTTGPCTGRTCCGSPAGQCNSGGCNGVSGLCTAAYIGCPCTGVDYNAGAGVSSSPSALNPLAATGFLANQSSTWSAKGTHELALEDFLDITTSGQYGFDTVGLGGDDSTGITLDQHVVAGITAEPFYIGAFGLKPSNSSSLSYPTTSFMSQLGQEKLIPSLSYGYTAGAFYAQSPILGSLTLGGYDSSRFIPNNIKFPLAGNDSSSPVVGIQSISAANTLTGNETLFSDGISVLIDTALPYIWLPLSACQAFEEAFGLSFDDTSQLYLVNDTIHQQLLNLNPSVTFSLGQSSDTINITFPYGAFDLQASKPLFTNGTNYFPLKRASSPDQYTLGRTFLQEAYLFVDYEQSNFSISQAQIPVTSNSNIITVDHSNTTSTANSTSSQTAHTSHHLSHGAIAGISVGSAIAFILLCGIAIFFALRKFRGRQKSPLELDGKVLWPGRPSFASPSARARSRITPISAPILNHEENMSWATSPTSNRSASPPTYRTQSNIAPEAADLKHPAYRHHSTRNATRGHPDPRHPVMAMQMNHAAAARNDLTNPLQPHTALPGLFNASGEPQDAHTSSPLEPRNIPRSIFGITSQPNQLPRQELAGSPAASEMPIRKPRHIYEMLADTKQRR